MKKRSLIYVAVGGAVLLVVAMLWKKSSSATNYTSGTYSTQPQVSGGGTFGTIVNILSGLSGIFTNVYGAVKGGTTNTETNDGQTPLYGNDAPQTGASSYDWPGYMG